MASIACNRAGRVSTRPTDRPPHLSLARCLLVSLACGVAIASIACKRGLKWCDELTGEICQRDEEEARER